MQKTLSDWPSCPCTRVLTTTKRLAAAEASQPASSDASRHTKESNMAVNHTIEGNKLIITVDLDVKPTQSKSAILKAAEKGIEANKVPSSI